jgi:hypothetical protein
MTPHNYALARGWDFTCIEDTARLGVSDADRDGLADAGITPYEMIEWCKKQVSESLRGE